MGKSIKKKISSEAIQNNIQIYWERKLTSQKEEGIDDVVNYVGETGRKSENRFRSTFYTVI